MEERICKICGKKCKSQMGLATHVNRAHNISLLDYVIRHEGFKAPKCTVCDKDAKSTGVGLKFWKTCCSKECLAKQASNPHTEETKQKLSKIRREFLKENPDKVPYRLNHYSKGPSYPERYFSKLFTNEGIEFETEVRISVYSLDFVLFGKKIDFEVDGSQHYCDQKIVKSDKRRTAYLESLGWKVIRVCWAEWMKMSDNDRKRYVKDLKEISTDDIETFIIKPKRKRDKVKARLVARVIKRRLLLEESCIDLTKWGWNKKVGDLFGISGQKASKFVMRYFPDLEVKQNSGSVA